MPADSGDDVATTLVVPHRPVVGAAARGHRLEQDMADINVDEFGPIHSVVVGFPPDKANFSGEMRPSSRS